MKYSNLCKICQDPDSCSNTDQYWGHRNALLCLLDCAGDFTWGKVAEVKSFFHNNYVSFYFVLSDFIVCCTVF